MDNKQAMQRLKEHKILFSHDHGWDEPTIQALNIAIKSLEAWDEVKKEMLSQSIIKTHTESYESGFSDGLERAFDIIQDIIEEYLGEE